MVKSVIVSAIGKKDNEYQVLAKQQRGELRTQPIVSVIFPPLKMVFMRKLMDTIPWLHS
jgi:hypothetical protein